MIKVTLSDASGRERIIEIDSTPQVFGRGEDSDIILGSRSVARHHLKIWEEHSTVTVEDMTGGTGLELDGERVTGTFSLGPGSSLSLGAFTLSLVEEKSEVSDVSVGVSIPVLRGTRGITKGLEIELQKGQNDVGRDPSLYLIMNDVSISRHHARLTVTDDLVTLVDLHSANGTFVNGKRVRECELHSGDVIWFGKLEFQFSFGEDKSDILAQQAKRKKKLVLISGSAFVILILIVGVLLSSGNEQKAVVVKPQKNPMETMMRDVNRHLRSVKNLMAELEWVEALKEVNAALDIHPICEECIQLKHVIEEEQANKSLCDECVVEYELNRWEKALECFQRLPKSSIYVKKSKYKINECKNHRRLYHMGEGKGYFNARRYKEAYPHFVAVMELDPCDQVTYNNYVKKIEEELQKHQKKFIPYKWVCEKETADIAVSKVNPEEMIKVKYSNPELADVVIAYYKGKGPTAISTLQKIVTGSMDQGLVEQARELLGYLRITNAKYQEGIALLLQGKFKEAKNTLNVALVNDRRIIPQGIVSFYREDINQQLADRLYKQGLEHFSRKEYRIAFERWSECLQFNPNELSCKNGMLELEKTASDALKFAEGLQRQENFSRMMQVLNEIKAITRSDSYPYKEADKQLRRYQRE